MFVRTQETVQITDDLCCGSDRNCGVGGDGEMMPAAGQWRRGNGGDGVGERSPADAKVVLGQYNRAPPDTVSPQRAGVVPVEPLASRVQRRTGFPPRSRVRRWKEPRARDGCHALICD